ncbi:MAG: hypothetical protein FWD27_05310 [Coriobacteriia bacterium]|nr:hypothetical protein [Coriobacteriia bacterium]
MMARTKRKKKPVLLIVLIVLLIIALVAAGFIFFQMNSSRYQNNIGNFEVATQQMGGATIINYLPVLADGIDWDVLSAEERAGTARYAVNHAIERAEADNAAGFNVMGLSAQERQTLFIYTGSGDSITLYVEGEYEAIPLNK